MIATILCALLLGGCGAADQGTISMDQYPVAVPRTEEESEEEADEEPLTDVTGMREELYVVVSIDTEERLIRLALPDSLRTVQYGYTRGTQILDDHGQFMSAARLAPGRVVTISELDDQAQLTMIQLAGDAWYQENITRFSIDDSLGMLVIGDTKYRYDKFLRVFSGDQEISLEQVSENDVISVQGVDKQILSVQVTTGHGTIALEHTELFEGGWISLGTKIYAKITPDMTLEVPEGVYELSVANDGYGDTKTVAVERSQVTTVDLDEYRGEGPKTCLVTFEIHVADALLYIDGEPVDYEEPVELRYGVYRLTVIADGFETWERQLVIHSQDATIQIGEPQLSEETEEAVESVSEETTGSSSASASDTAAAADSEAASGGESGTSSEDVTNSSTESYNDYLDTITDLVQSLVGLENE
ncbi:MAG: hypothetical protein MSA09_14565 [Lachnospiraceae bacterium]|nr:hypothetical protein [Lachnospiraceae bacterium]MDD7179047.1 hypothetical protein [bacterium]MDY5516298.1 hypothetical protein [Lachnospiraceae bacterium]